MRMANAPGSVMLKGKCSRANLAAFLGEARRRVSRWERRGMTAMRAEVLERLGGAGRGLGGGVAGGGGFGAIHFALHAFDEFDEGLGGASAVFDFGDVLAANAHHDGEFRAGDAEVVAEGFDACGEVAGGGSGFWCGCGRGGELDLV
jgi:hypothetical protein